MGSEGYDGQEHTTSRGKVVYRRKKHYFKSSDILRILIKYNNELQTDQARERNEAIKIRAIFNVASSLYAHVDDMFDKPVNVSDYEYRVIKMIWRHEIDSIIYQIAFFIGEQAGSPELTNILNSVGRMLNRGMEYLITGSTDF